MTCIVGLVDGKNVLIGGDAAATSNSTITLRSDPKVFRVGEYIMGYTSSFRMGDILELRCPAPSPLPKGKSLREHLIRNWVDQHLRRVYKILGYIKVESGSDYGGTFLIGTRDQLCEINDNFQVGTPMNGYVVVGSGTSYALGALHAMSSIKKLTGKEKVRKALQAAAAHNAYVRAPFTILRT